MVILLEHFIEIIGRQFAFTEEHQRTVSDLQRHGSAKRVLKITRQTNTRHMIVGDPLLVDRFFFGRTPAFIKRVDDLVGPLPVRSVDQQIRGAGELGSKI